jgi:hypothetical protein
MTIITDMEETSRLVSGDPYNWIEFAGIFRTQEFIDTMLHRVPDSMVVMRKDFIKKYCKGKRVIHLGCRGHSEKPNDLHGELEQICSELWGVDIQSCHIPNFIQMDLDKPGWHENVNRSFDVLLATEILEHLSNPGIFLDECRKFDCEILLTVPNAFCHNRYNIMRIGIEYDNAQHVAYYSFKTIQVLSERHGFEIKEFYWADYPMKFYAKGLIFVLTPV